MQAPNSSRSSKLLLAAPLGLLVGLIVLVMSIALLGSSTPGCGGSEAVGSLSAEVPEQLVPLYQRAADKYKLGAKGPSVLAAINFVETSFGTNVATSSAGASGWMAFLPSTWEQWGVDGDGDGDRDPYDAADAIFSAANYLRDFGAPKDWSEAVFAYNHADWYVEKVLHYARQFATGGEGPAVEVAVDGCASATVNEAEAVALMIAEADRLSAMRPWTEYVWGGSHDRSPTPKNGPFDCSSALSHLLQVGGYGNETMNTVGLYEWADQGPAPLFTIWDKPYGEQAHTFIEFKPGLTPPSKRYWGTSGFVEPGNGPGWIPERTFSPSYLSGFVQLHPPERKP
jgi:hypothetical protein